MVKTDSKRTPKFLAALLISAILIPHANAYLLPKFAALMPFHFRQFIDQSSLDKNCKTIADCNYPFIVCENQATGYDSNSGVQGTCRHKTLFPMTTRELIGLFVIVGVGMIAIAGGLGGGSLFVPLMMTFFEMNAHQAIPLSNALTFANSVVKYITSFNEKHPEIPHRPVVDFNVAIIFNPMMLLGSFVGVIAHIILPGVASLMLLFVTLVLATYSGARGTWVGYQKENKAIADALNPTAQPMLEEKHKDGEHNDGFDIEPEEFENEEENKRHEMIEKISRTEADTFPMDKMKLVVLCFLVTIGLPFILGGRAFDSLFGIERCTPIFWIGAIVYFVVVGYIWKKGANITLNEQAQKSKIPGKGWEFNEAIVWDETKVRNLSLYMFGVGAFSAIVGVGGGIYIVPTLKELGYHSKVISATSLFLVFWAKLASSFLFLLNGSLIFDYTTVVCTMACLGSWISLSVLRSVMAKVDRQSIITGCFALFVGVACIITAWKIASLVFGDQHGMNIWVFENYCQDDKYNGGHGQHEIPLDL